MFEISAISDFFPEINDFSLFKSSPIFIEDIKGITLRPEVDDI